MKNKERSVEGLSPDFTDDFFWKSFEKSLKRQLAALEEVILKDGLSSVEEYKTATGRYWGLNYALDQLYDLARKESASDSFQEDSPLETLKKNYIKNERKPNNGH